MRDSELIPGRATPEGTERYASRFGEPRSHFRRPDRLWLSSLALGTRNGEPGGVDDMLYRSAVSELVAGGVNVFVTALSDRMHASERCLGAALARAFREGAARRDEIVVVTKGGYLTPDPELAPSGNAMRRHLISTYVDTGLVDLERVAHGVHSLDAPFLRDQIERSRRNLRLATLDLYLLEEPELHLGECSAQEFRARMCGAFEALERAVADGAIAAYGLATWDGLLRPHTERGHLALLDVFEWALEVGGGDHHLRAVALPYNLAMAQALRLDSQLGPSGHAQAALATLHGTGTAVLASAPLARGRALGRLPGFVAESFPGCRSDAQRCLQFVRSTPEIASAVVGMRDPSHVEENLALARIPPVAPEALEELWKRAAARSQR
ncbi:MAG TPA: aldo/keto reductase [Myxococcota bacterium]|nr:aldo/keto reductase [Myxococcota bacterium]